MLRRGLKPGQWSLFQRAVKLALVEAEQDVRVVLAGLGPEIAQVRLRYASPPNQAGLSGRPALTFQADRLSGAGHRLLSDQIPTSTLGKGGKLMDKPRRRTIALILSSSLAVLLPTVFRISATVADTNRSDEILIFHNWIVKRSDIPPGLRPS